MTYLTERHMGAAAAGQAWRGVVVRAGRRIAALGRSLTGGKAIQELERLDDRLLADMGLTRADLVEAARWSPRGDASDRLAEISEARRAARAARAR